jgi:hypothetical protein
MAGPINNPLNSFPGAGKFEAEYALPLIPGSVSSIQFVPTVVGATNPRNVSDISKGQEEKAESPMLVTPLPMLIDESDGHWKNA